MSNPNKIKGDRGEREVEILLQKLLNRPTVRRELGAGRLDDRGDIANVPNTVIQVARCKAKYLTSVISSKIIGVEKQRLNKRVRFAASFIRWDRGPGWIVVMTPTQFARIWKYAQIGLRQERELRRAVLQSSETAKLKVHGDR